MSKNASVSISFKLDGDKKGFKELAKSADGFRKAIESAVVPAEQLKGNVINFAALSTGIAAAQRGISTLSSALSGLASDYAVQEVAERQLETVMQQRMGATDEEIKKIKELASAQQEIGVIGDEVQLAGAQQVATFLEEKKSIETLLPAMNNLLAQQKGLNATGGDAVSVANLMGKAMQGQTSALTRVGITFTEAQEKVMKYGTESERAAMLSQIITDNVGDMNSQLALTDSGKQKQLANTIGDIREELGRMAKGAAPFVTIAAQGAQALGSIVTLIAGIKSLTVSVYSSLKAFTLSTVAFIKHKGAALASAAAQKTVAITTAAWTKAQKLLNVALKANPIGLAVTAVGALVTALVYAYNNSERFRSVVINTWNAIKPLAKAIMNGLAKAFEWLVEKCKAAWEWLSNILGLGGKKAEITVDVSTNAPGMDLGDLEAKYADYVPEKEESLKTPKNSKAAEKTKPTEVNPEAEKLKDILANLQFLQEQLNEATIEEAANINAQIKAWEEKADAIRNAGEEAKAAAKETKQTEVNAEAEKLKDILANIQFLQEQLNEATIEEAAKINAQIKVWEEKADAVRNAGKEAEKAAKKIDTSFTSSWSSAKGLASGIEGVTDALKGNGNAWQTITGIVDGFIQMYEGFQKIIDIINALVTSTGLLSVMTKADTAEKEENTGALIANTGAALANTAAKSGESVANAVSSGSELPFPYNIAAIAAGVAAVVGALAIVGSFATGGIVGGNSKSGDKLLARVNSGEMILNTSQQSRLFQMLNGGISAPAVDFGTPGNYNINLPTDHLRGMLRLAGEPVIIGGTLRASGREIVCVLANETRLASKSGKRTQIKI